MHMEGKSVAEIEKITGSKKDTINRFIEHCEVGKSKQMKEFVAKDLSPEDICVLYGSHFSRK